MRRYSSGRFITIKSQVLGQINLLRRVLETHQGSEGTYSRGASLNPTGLVNTYRTSLGDSLNPDRFRVEFSEPSVKSSFHFVQDISGSMECWGGLKLFGKEERALESIIPSSPHGDITMCMAALAAGLESVRIPTEWAWGDFENIEVVPKGATSPCRVNLRMVKTLNGRTPDDKIVERMVNTRPFTGTDVALYAESAIQMAMESTADRRFAVFLTDGYSDSAAHLPDLDNYALANGVKLLGIILAKDKTSQSVLRLCRSFNKTMVVSSSEEFSKGLISFISKNLD